MWMPLLGKCSVGEVSRLLADSHILLCRMTTITVGTSLLELGSRETYGIVHIELALISGLSTVIRETSPSQIASTRIVISKRIVSHTPTRRVITPSAGEDAVLT